MTKAPDVSKIADILAKEDAKEPEIIIIDELRNLLDLPTDQERQELEKALLADGGPRDPIVLWDEQNAIVDGHNRYGICKAHGLKFSTVRKSFPSIEAVKEWMIKNQLSRRNLSPARVEYFIGTLYNLDKQDPSKARQKTDDGVTTAQKIGEQMGVSERTVRRAGDTAKGIDAVAKVLGVTSVADKIAAIKGKNDKSVTFTKEELGEVGKMPEGQHQEETVKELIAIKQEEKAATEAAKAAKPKPAKAEGTKKTAAKPTVVKATTYPVAFCKPAFDSVSFNPATEAKPPLATDAVLYMSVADEELPKALDLLKLWKLEYQCAFVFCVDRYEGMWSDIGHTFLIAASKGNMIGPSKAAGSVHSKAEDVEAAMIKLIETYHPQVKRFDMRKNRTATGWEKAAA